MLTRLLSIVSSKFIINQSSGSKTLTQYLLNTMSISEQELTIRFYRVNVSLLTGRVLSAYS